MVTCALTSCTATTTSYPAVAFTLTCATAATGGYWEEPRLCLDRAWLKAQAALPSESKERARRLLRALLTAPQRASLDSCGWFEVRGSRGGRYRIEQGSTANVLELDAAGRPRYRCCAHPGIHIPDEDIMLAQKLLIETDEPLWSRTVNRQDAGLPLLMRG